MLYLSGLDVHVQYWYVYTKQTHGVCQSKGPDVFLTLLHAGCPVAVPVMLGEAPHLAVCVS